MQPKLAVPVASRVCQPGRNSFGDARVNTAALACDARWDGALFWRRRRERPDEAQSFGGAARFLFLVRHLAVLVHKTEEMVPTTRTHRWARNHVCSREEVGLSGSRAAAAVMQLRKTSRRRGGDKKGREVCPVFVEGGDIADDTDLPLPGLARTRLPAKRLICSCLAGVSAHCSGRSELDRGQGQSAPQVCELPRRTSDKGSCWPGQSQSGGTSVHPGRLAAEWR